MKHICLSLLFLLTFPLLANATWEVDEPDTTSTANADADAVAAAGAAAGAVAGAGATGGTGTATAAGGPSSAQSDANIGEVLLDAGVTGATGNSTLIDTDSNSYWLPGHAAAAVVQGCHESNGSRGFLGGGSGGKTRINMTCLCINSALKLIELGYPTAGLTAFSQCGLEDVTLDLPAETVLIERELELQERAHERQLRIQDECFDQCVSK